MNQRFITTITKIMKQEAKRNVNNACALFCYQSEEPNVLNKLKKNHNK